MGQLGSNRTRARCFATACVLSTSLALLNGCPRPETGESDSGGQGGDGGSSATSMVDPTCGVDAIDATIADIASGDIPENTDVRLSGVVAMSQKFLVSKSSTGSCLWGVFLSAPGLSTTEANSGIMAISYGSPAEIPEGQTKAFCKRLGVEPAGDYLPDDVQPGDVLDLVGQTANFLLSQCNQEANGASVGQRQLNKVCRAERVGSATVPVAATLNSDDIAALASPSNGAFHDPWGNVKVRIEDVSAQPTMGASVVGDFGVISLDQGLEVGDKIYYRGYSQAPCNKAPVFNGPTSWSSIEGFSYLSYCTWGLQPNDKCSDFDPPSSDCQATTCAPY